MKVYRHDRDLNPDAAVGTKHVNHYTRGMA